MMITAAEAVGDKTLYALYSVYEALHFTALCLVHIIKPGSYHAAMRTVMVKQIYFTAVQVLPMFIFVGMIFGSVIIGYVVSLAIDYSLQEEIGTILVAFVMHEFAPFFTVMLIALRSGAAINTEIAVMHVNKELATLKAFHINVIDYLFLPRIIGGMVSIVLLTALFAVIMFASGYLFSSFFLQMDIDLYLHTIIQAITVSDFFILFGKSMAFGFFATLIPIYSGLKADHAMTDIPISVLNGMVKLFIAIFAIEVLSLLLQSL
ncbi:MAG: ABC transporter permease [Sulfurimonadaceae bacterium]|nr:ABC transporter permease [Sulfurimonadaceae bacterium]